MPPKFNGEVPLTLSDGRDFTLTFNHETLFEAEMAYGLPLHVLLAHLQLDRWGAVRAFLFAALRPRHPAVSLGDCSEMLLGGELEAIGQSIVRGLDAAMPDTAEGKEGANPPAGSRRGKTSGGSGAKRGSTRKGSGKPRRARSS